jgi:hypothetical protein
MISTILSIIAFFGPILYELLAGKDARIGRSNENFDEAIAANDTAAITRLLSQRYDSVRAKSNSDSR